jgi:hypothetical protein
VSRCKHVVGLAVAALVLALCLFGSVPVVLVSHWLGPVLQEMLATFRDPGTQWMVFGCCAVYFVTFALLQQRASGARGWRWGNPDIWLAGVLLIGALEYALDYPAASKATEALMLLGGIVLGKGASVWARWETASSEDGRLKMEDGRKGRVMVLLVIFLVVAVFIQNDAGMQFQYRGRARWNGPWDNPNIFGMLMGVGCVLAVGQFLSLVEALRRRRNRHLTLALSPVEAERESNRWVTAWRWIQAVFFFMAAGVVAVGLVKSYSRGAWLATAVGLGYLLCQASSVKCHEGDSFSRGSCGSRFANLLRRNLVPLASICVALFVIAFWNYRHTERPLARRAFSVGNVNDFSWRNRVAAWEGALQMMSDKPLLGFGWNRPERIYDHYYRPAKVVEGTAIQLNDYFMLGMTLGLPALVCLVVYIGMALNAKC